MDSNKTRLLSNQKFSEMQADYLRFIKLYDQISSYGDTLESFNKQEFRKEHSTFKHDVQSITETRENLKRLYKELSSDSSKKEQVESINNKIVQKSQAFDSMLRAIKSKDEEMANSLGMNLQVEDEKGSYTEDNIIGSFNEQELIITHVGNEEKFLKMRHEELVKSKEVSSQIKATTEMMKIEVNNQGEMLNVIETKVEETVDNTNKAEVEIKKADEMSKSNRTKCIWISLIAAAVAIVVVCLSVFL